MPNPNKRDYDKKTTGWKCPTTLRKWGKPLERVSLKELKERCWSKKTLRKGNELKISMKMDDLRN